VVARVKHGCRRTIANDLNHQNLGLWSARHRAYDRDLWRDIVETETLQQGMLHDDDDDDRAMRKLYCRLLKINLFE